MSDIGSNIAQDCARCGAHLSPHSTGHLCPACLLRAAMTDNNTAPQPPLDCPGYTLLEEIGRGGMGSVWRAIQLASEETVAIKILVGGPFSSGEEKRRFLREAEITRRLGHPSIVPVRELREADGHLFLVMDYVEGETLARRLRGEAIPARQVATWLRELADAVAHAHERGVVHRDLKPGNILLDLEGVPHVVDFGLASLIDRPGDASVGSSGLGTVSYLAPEQASGRRDLIGPATDIHGLGTVLFHCLTGRPPFVGDNIPAILRAVTEQDAPAPRAFNPAVPRDLETICLKCLEKEPERRYASARALAEDLARWQRCEPISARPPTMWERVVNHVRRHPVRAGLKALAVLAVLLIATFIYASQRTYFWLMGRIADEHLIVPPERDGVFRLGLHDEDGARCTYNLWNQPFGSPSRGGRFVRVQFANLPPEVSGTLQVQAWSDIPGYPDSPRSGILTNGQIFLLIGTQRRERAFYFQEANFATSNIVSRYPDAAIHLVLLGFRNDSNPHRPAGQLAPKEIP